MSIDDRTFKSVLFVALFLGAASLIAAEPTTTTADDRAAVERLRKAGVVLTETTGVVTGAFIKDTADMTDDNFAALGSLKNLKTLNISSKKLNDHTLGLLTGMTALEALLNRFGAIHRRGPHAAHQVPKPEAHCVHSHVAEVARISPARAWLHWPRCRTFAGLASAVVSSTTKAWPPSRN